MNYFQKIVLLLCCAGLVLGVVEPLWAVGQDVVTDDEVPYYNVEAHQDYMYDKVPAPESATRVKKIGNSQQSTVNGQQSVVDVLQEDAPMDLKDPSNVETKIEYDPETGNYIVRTMMGDEELVSAFTLTPDEYKQMSLRKQMGEYWAEKNKKAAEEYEDKFSVTDMKFSLGPAEKLFGPGGVQVKTQGSAELTFGVKHNNVQNYSLAERLRKTTNFDFDENIQLSVNATVGDKIGFTMNYNTEATFDFDQQLLKLNYQGKEDEIIKSIDLGNVSLPLNSSLIKGNSALFGLKTELQFGKLTVTAVASQQQSETKHVNSKGGSQLMDFEVEIVNISIPPLTFGFLFQLDYHHEVFPLQA